MRRGRDDAGGRESICAYWQHVHVVMVDRRRWPRVHVELERGAADEQAARRERASRAKW